jgi:hypothetical protein
MKIVARARVLDEDPPPVVHASSSAALLANGATLERLVAISSGAASAPT